MPFMLTPEQYAAHQARVRSQRSQMRADEAAHRIVNVEALLASPAARATPQGPRRVSSAPIYPLVGLCRAAGLPQPIPEYRFHPQRKWRADYAWPLQRVLVEIDGGAWTQGRHTRGAGFIGDQQKLNAATLLGFSVLRYTPDRLGECIADLRILFGGANT